MENIKVSMRYAKAIYPVIKKQGYTEGFIKDLNTIVSLINQSREFRLLIDSPIVPHSKKVSIFAELFKSKVSELTMAFIYLLISKGRAKLIGSIYHCINTLYNKENKIIECQVVSAFELNQDTKSKIEQHLKNVTQSDIIVNYSLDNNIIGGMLIKIEDKVYDITIKNLLKGLKKKMLVK